MSLVAMPRLAIAAGIFALNAWLYAPLFFSGEWPYRGSIEGGYAAMARFFAEHPSPWGWNPSFYCGLPSQFTYLPGLHYLAVVAMGVARGHEPYHVYRIVTALFACLAPVAVFLFVRRLSGSARWAAIAGVAYTTFSPVYGLLRVVEKDRGVVDLPWRLQVLVKYGEGPHTVGAVLLLFALAAVWMAAIGKGYRSILLAAVALAAVALTHWIAALALAICCVLMMLSLAGSPDGAAGCSTFQRAMAAGRPLGRAERRLKSPLRAKAHSTPVARVIAAGALGYLLACFWLTPSFVRTIAFNWPVDAFHYRLQHTQVWLLAGLAVGTLGLRMALRKAPLYPRFLLLCCFTFGYIVLFYDIYRLDTIPESRRYTLEFELFLVLALCEVLRRMIASADSVVRFAGIASGALILLAGWAQAVDRFTQPYAEWGLMPKERTLEYRLAQWLFEHKPSGRIFASGGLRYRLNAWFDLQQVGGTFETGLKNRVALDYEYQVRNDLGPPRDTLRKLQALGVEYLVVHGPASEEYYRDFKNPQRFDQILERVYADKDDFIYRVPLAGPPVRWTGMSAFEVQASSPGALDVPVNYDPGWIANQGGRRVAVARNELGLLRIEPAAAGAIELKYRGTIERRVMAAVAALTWIAAIAALFKYR